MKTPFTLICLMLAAGALQAQTWTGATSSDWGTSTNWNPNTVPGTSSNVTIPGSLSTYPKLSADVTIAALTMQSGSALDLNGNDFIATGNLSITSATISGGGSFSKTSSGSANVQSSTITTTLSITGYTGPARIYDNTITGSVAISNASSQIGDNYIDGNTISGDLSLTQNSNNSTMSEGYGSPSSTANQINGNATITQAGSQTLYTSYSRPTQFGGNLSFSHTGSGALDALRSSASVAGNLSLTGSAGSDELNNGIGARVLVGGTVNISVASGGSFAMRKITNSTSGGTISISGPTSYTIREDTLKSNVTVGDYTGNGYFYDNSITGNVAISNTSSQLGDNYVDGNNITGTFSLTQASNNNTMSEGYGSPSSHANAIGGNTTMSLTGSQALYSSYSRSTQFGGNLTVSHTGSGLLSIFRTTASVGGNLSYTSLSGAGNDELNYSQAGRVPIGGTVNISVASGHNFTMHGLVGSTAGGTVSVSGPVNVEIRRDTLKSDVTISNYAGFAHIFDNSITGNVSISNTSSQLGDNYIDGNNITGTFSLTQASNNSLMDEGFGSPSGHANVIGGNTTMSLTGVQSLRSSYARPTQFGGSLTVSHTGAGLLSIFRTSASVGGNFSLTSSAGSDELNNSYQPTILVGGTVNITVTSGGYFTMNRVKNNTAGGTVSVSAPGGAVYMRSDSLKSNLNISNYSSAGQFYDNSIAGNVSLSNTSSQVGANEIDGNNITGTFSLTQASNNSTMSEGYGSPAGNANVIGGNTTMSLTGSQALYSSYSRPTQFGGDLTISHTSSGLLSIFRTSASVGGNFSLTSSGSDELNMSFSPTVLVGGMVNVSAGGGAFTMKRVKNSMPGGTVSIISPTSVYLRADSLKSDVSVSGYTAAGQFFDNSISGNVSISNTSSQSGDNEIDGNDIGGNFTLTQASNNSVMYEGYNSPTGNGNHVGGNTLISHTGAVALETDYSHGGRYDGDFTVDHSGAGSLELFGTTAAIGGNFILNASVGSGTHQLNNSGSDIVDVGGKVRIFSASSGLFKMYNIRSTGPKDTVSITGVSSAIDLRRDTLNSAVLITGFSGPLEMYANQFSGETLLADVTGQSGAYYLDDNHFNGNFTLVHAGSTNVYEGYNGPSGLGNRVSGRDSIVNLSGAGPINMSFSHNHRADSSFVLNSNGNVNFSSSTPLIFGGASNGVVRNYGMQQIVLPRLTLSKTGGAVMNLEAPLSITNTLSFTSGYINGSAANPLVFTPGAGYSGAGDASHSKGLVMKVGNSAFTFPTGDGSYYSPCGITAPSSATDTFSGQYFRQSPEAAGYDTLQKASTINHVSRCEHWLINRSSTTSANVKVVLGFNAHSGVNDLSALTVAHWYNNGSGTKWYDEGNGGTAGTVSGTITSNNTISSFSPFTLASTTSANPLPITLSEFWVKASGHTAIVNWRSGNERGDERYLVQRSTDGLHFNTLGMQSAQGADYAYSFADPLPAEGLNYYRLAIEEPGQPLGYSAIQMLRFGKSGAATDVMLYPNPASETLFADGLEQHKGATLSIRNIAGQLLYQEVLSGQNRIEISLHELPAGAYLLSVDNTKGSVYRGRFLRR